MYKTLVGKRREFGLAKVLPEIQKGRNNTYCDREKTHANSEGLMSP